MKRVFLSSTARDLGRHRDAVYKAISGMDGYVCVRMEDFGARDFAADDFCRARVKECDVFVGLIGHLYGSSPEGSEKSFTEREYDAAVETKLARLLFVAADDFPLPANLLETEERRQGQLRFRERVLKGRLVGLFTKPDALATEVVKGLFNLKHEEAAIESVARAERVVLSLVEPAALRDAYLSHLMDQVGALSLEGIDPAAASGATAARLSLDAVYTALLTQSSEDEASRRQGAAGLGERRLLSALEQLNRHRRLVLLGDPGSGKSTFVNFTALCLAGEALGHDLANVALLRSPLPRDADYRVEESDEDQPQPWDHGWLLPVRVVLRDFAARGLPPPEEKATAQHLWAFIEKSLVEANLEGYAPQLERELHEKGGILLFDGLDEVPEAESRRERISRRCSPSAGSW